MTPNQEELELKMGRSGCNARKNKVDVENFESDRDNDEVGVGGVRQELGLIKEQPEDAHKPFLTW